jgi:antitoxin (DNA-binding transcriptional repressor) of toxin-antitoxin stability system
MTTPAKGPRSGFAIAERLSLGYSCGMKTVTKQQAIQGFDVIGDLAHAGETVIVTHGGKPWIKLMPALKRKPGKSATAFKARLDGISPKPIPGVADVLSRLRR